MASVAQRADTAYIANSLPFHGNQHNSYKEEKRAYNDSDDHSDRNDNRSNNVRAQRERNEAADHMRCPCGAALTQCENKADYRAGGDIVKFCAENERTVDARAYTLAECENEI